MSASMRIVFNSADSFVRRIPKLKTRSVEHISGSNASPLFFNDRKLSTKSFDSFKFCLESVRKYDYENYLCTLLLPEPVRSAAFVIRAFNVEISQVRDSVSTSAVGEMRMQFWKDSLERIFAVGRLCTQDNPPVQPVAQEVAKVCAFLYSKQSTAVFVICPYVFVKEGEFSWKGDYLLKRVKLSKIWFQRLISSRENLLSDKPFLSIKELENYCDHSVASVYFLILQSYGISDVHCDHAASHVGKSQGICNFLRGIPYNASKRRLFLPLEVLSKHKISQEGLLHGDEKTKLQDAVYEISSIAHDHLLLARKLSKDVSKEAKRVFLPAVTAGMYLENLEKVNFDVFHPKLQRRNNTLPFHIWLHKFKNTY